MRDKKRTHALEVEILESPTYADGSLAKGDRQRRLLIAEGIPFRGERVDMSAARVTPRAG